MPTGTNPRAEAPTVEALMEATGADQGKLLYPDQWGPYAPHQSVAEVGQEGTSLLYADLQDPGAQSELVALEKQALSGH